ncbi:MAG: ATP-binding cassette domain-containing protein [Deltaproteobacteria bacterium]|nr:MAG: ATP-binding cassette domain-containing protein [Deltaproteobacteria bacterium]
MSSPAIRVENLGKQYRIGGRSGGYSTIRDTLTDAFLTPFRRLKALAQGYGASDAPEIFWALKNVSFEVQPGEVVGIIGRNGAGKTTLLKILSRVTSPTEGRAQLFGRVGSLLEVGVGFHQELTGRENVYLSGAIMGMKKQEINRQFDQIVAFSGVEDFIDTPVKRYSSGMYTRLAFAVAAHMEPEILIVDEVLAVGDMAFQEKCLGKMSDVARSGRTVLFVSHNMSAISILCPTAILVEEGRIRFQGQSSETIARYIDLMRKTSVSQFDRRQDRRGNGLLRINRLYLNDYEGKVVDALPCGTGVRFVLEYAAADPAAALTDVSVVLMVASGATRLFSFISEVSGDLFQNLPPVGRFVCQVDKLPLMPGNYDLHFLCFVGRQLVDKIMFAWPLVVSDGDFFGTRRLSNNRDIHGSLLVPHSWSLESSQQDLQNLEDHR